MTEKEKKEFWDHVKKSAGDYEIGKFFDFSFRITYEQGRKDQKDGLPHIEDRLTK